MIRWSSHPPFPYRLLMYRPTEHCLVFSPKLAVHLLFLLRSRICVEQTFINPPIVRGSTVAFPTVKQRLEAWGRRYEQVSADFRCY